MSFASAASRTAQLHVAHELLGSPTFALPHGYREVSRRPSEGVMILLVEGPFEWLPEGAEVTAQVTQFADHLEWQWLRRGQNVADPVVMPLPQVTS